MHLTNGGKLSHKQMQYNYSKKIFTGSSKPIRIIGSPDKQLPDKWSSAVPRAVYKTAIPSACRHKTRLASPKEISQYCMLPNLARTL